MVRFGGKTLWRVVSPLDTPPEKAIPHNAYIGLYIYTCQTCGYVETYMSDVVENNETKPKPSGVAGGHGNG